MLVSSRAAVAVALLGVFPVLAVGLIGTLAAVQVLALTASLPLAFALAFLIVPAIVALVTRLRAFARPDGDEVPGVVVTPSDQPELWALVTRLAEQVGVRPPDGIRILADVNAGISTWTRMLGLRVLRREMFIGAPLLACLTENQLSAVLAHELAHQSGVAGVVVNGRDALRRTVSRGAGRVFRAYAKLFFALAMPICRRQEIEADALSAKVAGSAAAVSALREVLVIGAAWRLFANRYLTIAWSAGYLPTTFFDRFAELLVDPELREELDDIREYGVESDGLPHDAHPPLAERITAVERLLLRPAITGGDRLAAALLKNPLAVLDDALLRTLVDEGGTKTRVDWMTLVHIGGRSAAVRTTERLLEAAGRAMTRPPTLGTVLDALDAGKLVELGPTDSQPGSADAGPRARREFVRVPVLNELRVLVGLAFADVGLARWDLSWSGQTRLVIRPSHLEGLDDLVNNAVAEGGDAANLRAALVFAGIAIDYRPEVH